MQGKNMRMQHQLAPESPFHRVRKGREEAVLGTLFLIVLVILLLGALPTWPYSRSWGYYPSGTVGLILVILLILVLIGYV